jgi:hypothetical protein
MKFAVNHNYLFSDSSTKILAPLLKFLISVINELTCILVILTQTSPLEIVLNFIAVYIIN